MRKLVTKFIKSAAVLASAIPLLVTNVPHALAAQTLWLPPTGQIGSIFGWTGYPNPVLAHYMDIDEPICNGNTDYIYATSVATEKVSISLASIPNGSYISRVDFLPCLSAYNPGTPMDLRIEFRWNGVFQNTWRYFDPAGVGTTPVVRTVDSFGYGSFTFATPLAKNSSSVASLNFDNGFDFFGTAKISDIRIRFVYQ